MPFLAVIRGQGKGDLLKEGGEWQPTEEERVGGGGLLLEEEEMQLTEEEKLGKGGLLQKEGGER